MKLNSYQELKVWQKAMQLVRDIYTVTASFPDSEKFGLVGQMRRAAISVPSNIAEGANRGTTKDFMHFIDIALGSSAELETQTILARDIGYLKDSSALSDSLIEVRRMMVGLHQSLRNK